MRENGGTGDLADIILEEEDLPFRIKKKAGSFIDQLFDNLLGILFGERLF